MQTGKFITLEGGEGAGKSTNAQWLLEYLQQQGQEAILTREPGGTEVAEAIREVLLSSDLPAMHADTELLLMFSARNEHLQKKILPALQAGKWVICDRFTDATYAYQGYGRSVSLERIAALETWVQGGLRPDHVLLFDIDVEIGMQRVLQRGGTDRFEQEHADFFERIRQGYLTRAQAAPQQYAIIDAARPLEAVKHQLKTVVDNLLQDSV